MPLRGTARSPWTAGGGLRKEGEGKGETRKVCLCAKGKLCRTLQAVENTGIYYEWDSKSWKGSEQRDLYFKQDHWLPVKQIV